MNSPARHLTVIEPGHDKHAWSPSTGADVTVEQLPGPATTPQQERASLTQCEAVIERGLTTFFEVGHALVRIRDGRLYRATHPTFEDYCRERWNITRKRAYDLTAAAEVASRLSPIGDTPLPSNEAVARELTPLRAEPDRLREAWQQAVEAHGPQPTAAQVRAVVRRERSPATNAPAAEQAVTSVETTADRMQLPELSGRQLDLANAAYRRLVTVLGGFAGTNQGLEDFPVQRALAVMEPAEAGEWINVINDTLATLRRLRQTLQDHKGATP